MADEIFKIVAENDISKVLDSLENDWPNHFMLHQLLKVVEQYKRAGTKFQHTLYLYGDYQDGVYVNKLLIELPTRSMMYFYVYTTNSCLDDFDKAMKETSVIPWEGKFQIFMIHDRFTDSLVQAYTLRGITCNIAEFIIMWFPPDKELNVHYYRPLPEELYMKFLDGSYAEHIDANWPHSFPGSEITQREHLEKNFGLGLFQKSDDKMVCSGLSNYQGGISVLFSEPEVRGRGYAKFLIQEMSRELRRRGLIPLCSIRVENMASKKVFTKCGFELFHKSHYIYSRHYFEK